jgi:hypothetical protein
MDALEIATEEIERPEPTTNSTGTNATVRYVLLVVTCVLLVALALRLRSLAIGILTDLDAATASGRIFF